MKKKLIVVLTLLTASVVSFAQKQDPVKFYGVDFTQVKVYGADESVDEFVEAFRGINLLFLSEPDKYDFSRVVGSAVDLKIKMMIKRTEDHDFSDFLILDRDDAGNLDVQEIVKAYPLQEKEGKGLVIIASLLDKVYAQAAFDVVLFDIETRQIIHSREFVGTAKGFGLRNYWAGAVYKIVKKVRL